MSALFGRQGAYSGCWCMWWRVTQREFNRGNASNRASMEQLVAQGQVPGLLAYLNGHPVGWCSVAPRGEYGRLQRSRVRGPVDDQPVWSIVCFFIHHQHRRRGVATSLLRAAVGYAAGQGARIVEAYPVDPSAGRVADAAAYTGLLRWFLEAGFREVARRAPGVPIVRYVVAERA